jgi:trehalose 6-phosphate phosphatase
VPATSGAGPAEPIGRLLAPLRGDPSSTLLAFDFDGTLSPIVDDPAAAQPIEGAAALLDELAGSYRRVVVVSGRPVSFLARHLPGSVALSGLYGLESLIDGIVLDHPDAVRWRPIVHEAAALAERESDPGQALAGLRVENKGLSLTLHVRTHPELEEGAVALAEQLAADLGLRARAAKRSVELHPPIEADKGTALTELVGSVDARHAMYVGDDLGDLPAFDALARLSADGVLASAVSVAVGGPELPDDVARRSAAVLDGPHAVPALLRALRP